MKTCNSKSSKAHTDTYPLLDIRGDGGYSLIQGYGYEWLRDPEAIDDLALLPSEGRKFFGLLEPSIEREPSRNPTPAQTFTARDGSVTEQLILRALREAAKSGRNNGGHWLVQQLHDHGYEHAEVLELGQHYVDLCPATDTNGKPEPYTYKAFCETVEQVLRRPRREPFLTGEVLEDLNLGDLEGAISDAGEPKGAADQEEIRRLVDEILVPTGIGVKKKYPPWAIKDFVRVGERGMIYGMAGSAKSYAATDLVRAAVTGTEWLGKQVKAGSVIYIAAEDYIGIHHRVEATLNHHEAERRHEARVLERSLSLTNETSVEKFKSLFDLLDEKPAYVIVDNLSLCMGEGDPNEATSAKAFLDGCQALQDYQWRSQSDDPEVRATDEAPITVIIIHHTNKAGNFNGSQYFINFVQVQSELVWEPKEGEDDLRTLFCRKQRYGPWHRPMSFELLEIDSENCLCVIVPRLDAQPVTPAGLVRRKLTANELRVLTVLRLAAEEALPYGNVLDFEGLTRGQVTLRCGLAASSCSTVLSKMERAGLVEKIQPEVERGERKPHPHYRLTEEGHALLAASDLPKLQATG